MLDLSIFIGRAVGIGRLGGIAGPLAGGLLVSLGLGMTDSFAIFAIPYLVAVVVLKLSSPTILN